MSHARKPVLHTWLHFEAGALAKAVGEARVCPYLWGLRPQDLPAGPLTQLQVKEASEEGTADVVRSFNQALGEDALGQMRLEKALEVWWPELNKAFAQVPDPPASQPKERTQKEIVAEILSIVRQLQRDDGPMTPPGPGRLRDLKAAQLEMAIARELSARGMTDVVGVVLDGLHGGVNVHFASPKRDPFVLVTDLAAEDGWADYVHGGVGLTLRFGSSRSVGRR